MLENTTISQFKKAITNGVLSHAYLIEGGDRLQREQTVLSIATLIMQSSDETMSDTNRYQQLKEHDHADFIWLEPTGRSIKIDQIRELVHLLSQAVSDSKHRVFVIEEADAMTTSASNSLLKFLEEPGQNMHLFLLTESKEKILPTVQSRCQWIHLTPPSVRTISQQFEQFGMTVEQATWLAYHTSDSDVAKEWQADDDYWEKISAEWTLFTLLTTGDVRAFVRVDYLVTRVVTDRTSAISYLNDLIIMARDVLLLSVGQKDVFISKPEKRKDYERLKDQLSVDYWVDLIAQINFAIREVDANVAVASAFERLAIWSIDRQEGLNGNR